MDARHALNSDEEREQDACPEDSKIQLATSNIEAGSWCLNKVDVQTNFKMRRLLAPLMMPVMQDIDINGLKGAPVQQPNGTASHVKEDAIRRSRPAFSTPTLTESAQILRPTWPTKRFVAPIRANAMDCVSAVSVQVSKPNVSMENNDEESLSLHQIPSFAPRLSKRKFDINGAAGSGLQGMYEPAVRPDADPNALVLSKPLQTGKGPCVVVDQWLCDKLRPHQRDGGYSLKSLHPT